MLRSVLDAVRDQAASAVRSSDSTSESDVPPFSELSVVVSFFVAIAKIKLNRAPIDVRNLATHQT